MARDPETSRRAERTAEELLGKLGANEDEP